MKQEVQSRTSKAYILHKFLVQQIYHFSFLLS